MSTLLNSTFDKIYVITLENFKLNQEKMRFQFKKLGAEFEFFKAINGSEEPHFSDFQNYRKEEIGKRHPIEIERNRKLIESPGAWGCILSHIAILEEAKKKGYKRILILEDDCHFDNDFENKLESFLSAIRKDWKFLFLGASEWGQWEHIEIHDKYYKPTEHTCGSFAIAIASEAYDILINAAKKFATPYDVLPFRETFNLFRDQCFVAYPNIIMPDVQSSSIRSDRNQIMHSIRMHWKLHNFEYPLNILDGRKLSDGIKEDYLKEVVDKSQKIIKTTYEELTQNTAKPKSNNPHEKKTLISLIIPVYNVAKYLPKLFESILENNRKGESEWIFIDDCSTDDSAQKIKFFATQHPYINTKLIVHHKNKGLGGARNTGIDAAKGDYITFLDSDDTISNDYLSQILEEIDKENADIVFTTLKSININAEVLWDWSLPRKFMTGEECLQLFSEGSVLPSACNKIFKKHLFETLRFKENMFYEDLELIPKLISISQKIISVPVVYFYHQHVNPSITRQKIAPKHIHDLDYVINSVSFFLINKGNVGDSMTLFVNRWRHHLIKVWKLEEPLFEIASKQLKQSLSALLQLGVKVNADAGYKLYNLCLEILKKYDGYDLTDIQEITLIAKRILLIQGAELDARKFYNYVINPEGVFFRKEKPQEGLVSVIIPTYKRVELLKYAINSVLSQTYNDIEVIVVDDNANDLQSRNETAALINSINSPKLKYYQLPVKGNGAFCRNFGVEYSTGEFISFLDDDDAYLPEKIEKSIDVLKNTPTDIGAVYCGFTGWNSKNNDLSRYLCGDLSLEFLTVDYSKHYLCTNTSLYKRSVFEKVGGYDVSFTRHQDMEFNLRFFQQYKITCVPEALVKLRPSNTLSVVDNSLYGKELHQLKLKFLRKFKFLIKRLQAREKSLLIKNNWAEVFARYSNNTADFFSGMIALEERTDIQYFSWINTNNEVKPIDINPYLEEIKMLNESIHLLKKELEAFNVKKIAIEAEAKALLDQLLLLTEELQNKKLASEESERNLSSLTIAIHAKQRELDSLTIGVDDKKAELVLMQDENSLQKDKIENLAALLHEKENGLQWYGRTYDHLPKWYLKIGAIFRRIKF